MDRNVFISIRGLHHFEDQDGSEREVEMVSPGHYYKRGGKHYVSYVEEAIDENEESAKALVKLDDEGLTISRSGFYHNHLFFQEGKRNKSIYETPFGVLEMGVTTKEMDVDLKEHNFNVKVNFSLDINNYYSGEHKVEIKVQDGKGNNEIRLS